jgi:hypothetical protein
MFHFPTFPPHALCVQARVTPHDWCGVPPFGHPRINARLTAPRGLSQPPTSFIGSWCPGIHRVPLTTWPHKKPHIRPRKETICAALHKLLLQSQKMLASTVQFSTYNRPPTLRPRRTPSSHRRTSGTRTRQAPTQGNQPHPQHPGRARSLRTQQRAYHRLPPPPRSPPDLPEGDGPY